MSQFKIVDGVIEVQGCDSCPFMSEYLGANCVLDESIRMVSWPSKEKYPAACPLLANSPTVKLCKEEVSNGPT